MVAGHLQEKNGYFYIVLSYKDENGKRKTPWFATDLPVKGNKKRAEALLLEKRQSFMIPVVPAAQDDVPEEEMLFTDFLQSWLPVAKSTVKLTTYATYVTMVKSIISPYFAERWITLKGLTASDIQGFYTQQLERVNANTVIHYHARAAFLALLAATLYALSTPFSKLLLEHVPAAMMAAFLYLGAGAGLSLIRAAAGISAKTKKRKPLTRKELPYLIGMVCLDIAAPIFMMIGLSAATAANASLLSSFEIAATALIALLLFRETISKRLWLAIALVTVSSALRIFERPIDGSARALILTIGTTRQGIHSFALVA